MTTFCYFSSTSQTKRIYKLGYKLNVRLISARDSCSKVNHDMIEMIAIVRYYSKPRYTQRSYITASNSMPMRLRDSTILLLMQWPLTYVYHCRKFFIELT